MATLVRSYIYAFYYHCKNTGLKGDLRKFLRLSQAEWGKRKGPYGDSQLLQRSEIEQKDDISVRPLKIFENWLELATKNLTNFLSFSIDVGNEPEAKFGVALTRPTDRDRSCRVFVLAFFSRE